MKNIFTYLFAILSIGALLVSCKDDSLVAVPDWGSGVHGYGVLTSDPAVGFSTSNKSATVDVNFLWKSIDKLNTVTNIDLYVAFNEAYVDKDGNNAVASHGGSFGLKVKSVTPLGNAEVGSFTISQDEVYAAYQSATFDYGFGDGSESVYSDPLGKGRSSNKKFVPGDTFTLKWILTTDDGRVFDSWSPSVCTEFPEVNCQLDWAVSCATEVTVIAGDWTISGVDDWTNCWGSAGGDSWNGAEIQIIVDGELFDTFTVEDDGSYAVDTNEETFTIPNDAESISFVYVKGEYDCEVAFKITNPNGNVLNTTDFGDVKSNAPIILDLCNE